MIGIRRNNLLDQYSCGLKHKNIIERASKCNAFIDFFGGLRYIYELKDPRPSPIDDLNSPDV
jgi:hypothetical protein